MAKGLLVAGLDFTQVDPDEFNDWYDSEHLPERVNCPGFINAHRWLSVDNPRVSLTTYDLERFEVLREPGYLAIGYENLSPWSKRVVGKCGRVIKFEGEQAEPGDAIAPEGAGGLLMVAMNIDPAHEADFFAWYHQEHLPGLLAVPGVICGRRFWAKVTTLQRYLALYHLESPEVVLTEAWSRMRETPWTYRIRPYTQDRLRLVLRPYRRER